MPTAANIAAAEAMFDTGTSVEAASEPNATGAPPTGARKTVAASTPVPVDGEKDPARVSKTINPKRNAEGKFQKAMAHVEGALETLGKPAPDAEKAPETPKTDAELRREKLAAQLDDLRGRNAERKARTSRDATAQQLAAREAELERERARLAGEAAKWEAVDKDPIAGLQAMGRDVGEHFMKLSEAAKNANTPEAKIAALEALLHAQGDGFKKFQQQLAEREEAAEKAAHARALESEQAAAKAELNKRVTVEAYPHARAYFSDDEIALLGDMYADRQRAKGITPSYESVASDIETTAREHHATVLSKLPQGNGASGEQARRAPTERAPGTVPQTQAASTLSNDLATATASGGQRRKTLEDRQRDAQRLLE